MTTVAGTLPLRNPGTRICATELARGLLDAALDLLGGDLGLDAHARLGKLGDGGGDGVGHDGALGDDSLAACFHESQGVW